MSMRQAILTVVLSLIMVISLTQLINKQLTPNTRYSYAGKQTAILDNIEGSPYGFNISFPNRILIAACIISFGGLQLSLLNNTMSILITVTYCDYDRMNFAVKINNRNSINKLAVSFLIYRDGGLHGYHAKYYSGTLNQSISKDPSTFKVLTVNFGVYIYNDRKWRQLNLKAVVTLNGITALTDSSLALSISLSTQILVPTTRDGLIRNVKVVISSKSQISTYIQDAAFTVLLHRSPNSGSQIYRYANIYSQRISSYNTALLRYSNDRHKILDFNTFVGLSSLHTSNKESFNFAIQISQNTIFGYSSALDELTLSFVIIYTKWCSYNSPYYDYNTNRCYKQCPIQTTDNWLICQCGTNSTCPNSLNQQYQEDVEQYTLSALFGVTFTIAILLLFCNATVKLCKRPRISNIQQAEQNSLYLQRNTDLTIVEIQQ